MRISLTLIAGVAVATTLAGASAGGCSSHSKSSSAGSASSAPAKPNDYTALLIKAGDINAPETFTASPPINNPNGQPGAAITFSDHDRSHAITDTIQILP
ncbi:MAG: hypothetical protein J2P17_22775, partial [Mycobacterium sp.]|nr:hypothetical protein [Mycobacterium sp.]